MSVQMKAVGSELRKRQEETAAQARAARARHLLPTASSDLRALAPARLLLPAPAPVYRPDVARCTRDMLF